MIWRLALTIKVSYYLFPLKMLALLSLLVLKRLILLITNDFDLNDLTLLKMGGLGVGGGEGVGTKRPPPTTFSPVTSTNISQSQIIELEPRPPLKKSHFSGQLLIKLRL